VREAASVITAESSRLLKRQHIQSMYAETAQLSGDVSVVTYCRIRVPDQTAERMNPVDLPASFRRTHA